MPRIEKPRLVNRGPAGLLTKVASNGVPGHIQRPESHNKISISLKGLIVAIDSLVPDPQNARLHGDRNMEAIMDSLAWYGQMKPVVVRKQSMIIVAGNGTVEAAKKLGWTKIAANIVPMTEIEAAGYGLADNRTAELAKWDFEIVARLDKLILEASQPSIGWSADELEVLRAAEWVPPPIDESITGESGETGSLLVSFTPDQYTLVGAAISAIQRKNPKAGYDDAQCLQIICKEWIDATS